MKTYLSLVFGSLLVADASADSVDIRIQCDKPTVSLSPHLYGLFFEDINFGADGGLYAELVQNRSFEYFAVPDGGGQNGQAYQPLSAWEKIECGGSVCELAVENARPLNANNPNYLEIRIAKNGGAAGVGNSGFDGIRIDAGARYDISIYARTAGWSGDAVVTAALELPGGTVAGSTTIKGLGGDWKKLESVITADKSADNARLVVTTTGKGTLALDMVSLFPQDTWNGRKNGLRKDLVQAIQELNPKFLRFPGGCIAHGHGLANAYRWKDSVGDVAGRKPNWNRWGYHQTYGLGYFEYFQLCADLGMAPLPVVPVGVSCGFNKPFEVVPMDQLQPWIDDALDLIEFANGPVSSKWGALRAKMGHPEPFGLEFICLGNEEHDNAQVRERFPHFVAAIRKAHPEIKIIGTSGLGGEIPLYDLMTKEKVYSSDEHYYENPEWFIANQHRFDGFDRSKPKIFVGEYASKGSTLFNAVAEAAYLTGVERNGDIVDMTCYAPLFASLGHTQWNPDLIYFDKRTVVKSANYYVQQLFGQNKGDVFLANTVSRTGEKPRTVAGQVGIGSWRTAIEVDRISVNGQPLDLIPWKVDGGDYRIMDGRYVQSSSTAEPAMAMSSQTFDGETVTYSLRAKKTDGSEGFLVRFGTRNGEGGYWWNVGGWGNKRHGIERFVGDTKTTMTDTAGSVRTGVWYDLKVELSPGRIQCFLDGKRVHDFPLTTPAVSVASSLDRSAGEVIVKLVNPGAAPVDATISLHGARNVQPKAKLITLAGDGGAVNTLENPDVVKPETREITVSSGFPHQIPAMSVQFIRVKAQ